MGWLRANVTNSFNLEMQTLSLAVKHYCFRGFAGSKKIRLLSVLPSSQHALHKLIVCEQTFEDQV